MPIQPSQQPSAHTRVVPAGPEKAPALGNLLELYIHDFSEFHNVELGADGRFGYKSLPLYWTEPERYPFLIEVDGKLAGFALVKKGSPLSNDISIWDMAEFFVVRAYRRRGIGIAAAHQLWIRFPGPWEVRVMPSNRAALNFWQRAIASYNGQAIHKTTTGEDGKPWYVFCVNPT